MSRTMLIAGAGLMLALAACGDKKPAADAADPAANASAQDEVVAADPNASASGNTSADPNAPPVDGEATLKLSPTAVIGANIDIAWTGPANGGDYVDIVPRGYTDVQGELSYAYVRNSNGSVTVRAPTTAGDYDVRYVVDLAGDRKAKAVTPLTVTTAQATLQAPAAAAGGEALSVVWTGPNGPGDYIDIVKSGVTQTSGEITYAYTSAGSPAKLEVPGAAGDYDIRYLLEGPGGRKVVAASKLKVAAPKATLEAPENAKKGEAFKVDWTGPRSSGDYVDLVKKGHAATSGETDYFYVGTSASGELTAPEAGDFEIRYVLEAPGGRQVIAKRPINVR
jgi:Ca-activated chloride channel family protein